MKTIQEIMDEQRSLSKVHLITQATINRSVSHKGMSGTFTDKKHTDESKLKIGISGEGRVPWNKDIKVPLEKKEKNIDYVYYSPQGEHATLDEIVELYKDVYTFNNLKYWTTISRNGFSRIRKEDLGRVDLPTQTKSQLPSYTYITPKGLFKSLAEVNKAHPDLSMAQIRGWFNKSKNGFSKKPIDA
jgi:hypothetical protein